MMMMSQMTVKKTNPRKVLENNQMFHKRATKRNKPRKLTLMKMRMKI